MNAPLTVQLVLGTVALALVSAVGYALYGKSGLGTSKNRQQVKNGFAIVGGILIGALLFGFLVIGIGIVFFGVESSRISSKPVAFFLAVASFCVIAFFTQRWAKYFAGWTAWGVFNALLMVSSGHLVNNPSVLIPRTLALTMAGLMVIAVITTIRFKAGYKLNAVDKTSLLVWVLAFAIAANTERHMLRVVTGACAGLVLASIYHWYSHRRLRTKHDRLLMDSR